MQRDQRQIYKGTIEAFECLPITEICVFKLIVNRLCSAANSSVRGVELRSVERTLFKHELGHLKLRLQSLLGGSATTTVCTGLLAVSLYKDDFPSNVVFLPAYQNANHSKV